MSVLRKRDAKPVQATLDTIVGGGRFGVSYPSVWEMLSSSKYEDGSPRLMATLTLFVDDGGVKGCLNDRDQGLTAWASGDSVEGVLEALERGLRADTIEWKASPKGGKKKR